MKIKDLITELQEHDPEMEVMVAGYEGGYHSDLVVGQETVMLDRNKEWYYGPHESTCCMSDDEVEEGKGKIIPALVIGYYNRRD